MAEMRRTLTFGAALLLCAAAPPGSSEPLTAMDALVGSCWSGTPAPGARDTHCFERAYGHHIRDRHAVEAGGKIVYSGETIYSAEAGSIAFTYFSSIGGIGRGTVRAVAGGLDFRLAMRATPNAAPAELGSTWRWRSADAYDVTNGSQPPVRFTRTAPTP